MQYKKKVLTIVIVSLLALMISGCTNAGAASSWPGYSVQGDTGYVSYGAQTYAVNLTNGSLVWNYPAEQNRSRQAYSAPQVVDDLVVIGDYANILVAVNEENGVEKWQFSGAEDRYVGSVAASQGIIYAPNADGYIYALNSEGDLQWKFQTEGPNWSQPVVDGQQLYYASMDHLVYAIDLAFESADLELDKDGSRTLRSDFVWKTDLGMAIIADPVIVDGVLFAATIEGKVFALDAVSGEIIWSFDNGGNLGAVWGAPVIDDTVIFIADTNGDVYTLEKETGKQIWPSPFNAGGKIVGSGVLTSEGVVFATEEGKLFLVNEEKEAKTLSSFENAIYSSVEAYEENVLIAPTSEDGLLASYDLEGFEVWSFVPTE